MVRVVVQAGPTAVVMRAHKGTIAYGVEVGTLATLWGTENREIRYVEFIVCAYILLSFG